jgi:tellurite resistance protein TerA
MVTLKPKVTLKDKGASANLPTLKQARVVLQWKSNVDLDLMAFYKKKSGGSGSVFTKLLGGSEGDLNSFPFVQMAGDAGVGGNVAQGGNEEAITIAQIDPDIDELHIVCLNYTDASKGNTAKFSNYDATINIIDQNGTCLVQGQLNAAEEGVAAHLCTIKNSPIGASFVNSNKIYDLAGLMQNIPGASALSK